MNKTILICIMLTIAQYVLLGFVYIKEYGAKNKTEFESKFQFWMINLPLMMYVYGITTLLYMFFKEVYNKYRNIKPK